MPFYLVAKRARRWEVGVVGDQRVAAAAVVCGAADSFWIEPLFAIQRAEVLRRQDGQPASTMVRAELDPRRI